MKLLTLAIALFLIFACSKSNQSTMKDHDQKQLIQEYEAIKKIYSSFSCEATMEWTIIGLGNRACGGFQEFLAYPDNIDQEKFKQQILDYNDMEKEFNINYNIVSTCESILPPHRVICKDGKALLVYNNY
ncbi:hypothetical protein ACFRAE_14180 [Sphingobacterium sp. HJSM2_6]|uniref:hypothetical protein n=1 Tax=Sphingobacterium sp. HJSM2_6 TaxID=3366264 RepID=UPI003BC98A83